MPVVLPVASRVLSLRCGRRKAGRPSPAQLKKMAVPQAIAKLIHEDGGPLIWPRITEGEQDSFDATCRRLYKDRKSVV